MLKRITAVGLMFVACNSFAQSDVAKANWAPVVKIDGSADEWTQPLRFYDNDSKLFYSFVNDDKNLYLCFETDDEINQAKIMRAGMKVSLSTKTKDKHKISIDFPVTEKTEALPEDKPKFAGQKPDRGDFKSAFLAHHTTMEIKGFATKDGVISINDSSGINAAINWDATNKFIYEIAIPLKELYGAGYTPDDISKDISLTAEVNAVKKGEGGDKAYSGKGGGRMGGGGMGHGGGRMGGGGGRGGGNRGNATENNTDEKTPDEITAQHTSMYDKSTVKQKFNLATKP
jgi:uncharacterized membrane protein YgcG